MIQIHIHTDARTTARAKRLATLLRSRTARLVIGAALLVAPVVAIAAPLTVPHSFSAGEVISSSEMNQNFAAAKAAIDDNDARITTLEATPALAACTWTRVVGADVTTLTATCPAGAYAISGGCSSNTANASLRISRPNGISTDGDLATLNTTWHCGWELGGGKSAYALCCTP